MRNIQGSQMKLGEVAVSRIKIDTKSRDEIPKIMMGLQHIYCTKDIRQKVFGILEDVIAKKTSKKTGRLGMDLWNILVLGVVRLNCDWDYDKLREIANNHKTLRQMLGHGIEEANKEYPLQTLRDNVSLLTPEVLERINQVVVQTGHNLVHKKKDEGLRGRCDSFVVKTDVHYPTDINLLLDAMRKVIQLVGVLCSDFGLTAWRQSHHNFLTVKKAYRNAQQLKRAKSQDAVKKAKRVQAIVNAHQDYVDLSRGFIDKAKRTMAEIRALGPDLKTELALMAIEGFVKHAQRQIDQITRRVIQGKTIPHEEKVFSIFEPHTEWITKGKAGVPQELGLRVGIVEDQYKFILHHRVMENETDDKVAVPMIRRAQKNFPVLQSCSFDKGYHSPANRIELGRILENVILPKKGKLTFEEKELECSEDFISGRKRHSAVESAISALDNHGLDMCPDHGIYGFKRYVALAVLARNIQNLGNILQQKEAKRQARKEKAEIRRLTNHRMAA